jgi:hypothetical protein
MAAKSDIWRLYKMFYEGGLYIDLDRLCNRPLDAVCGDAMWVLPFGENFTPAHDVMLSAPSNPVFREAVRLYWERRRAGQTNVFYLGPQTYTHAVMRTLGGEVMDPYSKEVKLCPDNPPYDTVLFNGEVPFNHEAEKRKLYAEFGLKHWTGEW